MAGYSIESLGCRASAADGDAIAAALAGPGGMAAVPRQLAQVVVINTCSVTAQAERTARALIRRVSRENPEARIVVTGCYAQRAPAELAAMAEVHAVVGNSHKGAVAQVAQAALAGTVSPPPARLSAANAGFVPLAALTGKPAPIVLHTPFNVWPPSFATAQAALPLSLGAPARSRTRPILKVQDGCGNRCSFCVIPETRGPSRSVPLVEAVAAARGFAEGGGQELVLSGINLGRWGRELRPARALPDLVHALLAETGLPRLRLSSIEPMDWEDALLALFAQHATGAAAEAAGAHPRLAPHAHLPLQSGADATLRGMHRRYRPWHYADKVHRLRAMLPEAGIGADVMVGFPGETDTLFAQSYDFLAALPLTYLHLFPFSPRPGTAAERLHREQPVHAPAVRERMQALEALSTRRQQDFADRWIGKRLSAVTLGDGTALTANYVAARLAQPAPPNQMVWVRLARRVDGSLEAQIENQPQAAGRD